MTLLEALCVLNEGRGGGKNDFGTQDEAQERLYQEASDLVRGENYRLNVEHRIKRLQTELPAVKTGESL